MGKKEKFKYGTYFLVWILDTCHYWNYLHRYFQMPRVQKNQIGLFLGHSWGKDGLFRFAHGEKSTDFQYRTDFFVSLFEFYPLDIARTIHRDTSKYAELRKIIFDYFWCIFLENMTFLRFAHGKKSCNFKYWTDFFVSYFDFVWVLPTWQC